VNIKQLLRKLASVFICYRVDVAGKYADQPRPDWGTTIFMYVVIAIFILIAVFFVRLGPETTGWYGTHRTP